MKKNNKKNWRLKINTLDLGFMSFLLLILMKIIIYNMYFVELDNFLKDILILSMWFFIIFFHL